MGSLNKLDKLGAADAFLAFQALLVAAFVGVVVFGLGDWIGIW